MFSAAEQLVSAFCLRRNIMTFPAPPRNEGYDLVCVHSDPRKVSNAIRVQVKSRYQTDSNSFFDFNPKSIGAFNYLAAVYLNVGFYYSKTKSAPNGLKEAMVFIIPHDYVKEHYIRHPSRPGIKLSRNDLSLNQFLCPGGLEQIANDLKIPYPN